MCTGSNPESNIYLSICLVKWPFCKSQLSAFYSTALKKVFKLTWSKRILPEIWGGTQWTRRYPRLPDSTEYMPSAKYTHNNTESQDWTDRVTTLNNIQSQTWIILLLLVYCQSPTDARLTINSLQRESSVFSSICSQSKLFMLLDVYFSNAMNSYL